MGKKPINKKDMARYLSEQLTRDLQNMPEIKVRKTFHKHSEIHGKTGTEKTRSERRQNNRDLKDNRNWDE